MPYHGAYWKRWGLAGKRGRPRRDGGAAADAGGMEISAEDQDAGPSCPHSPQQHQPHRQQQHKHARHDRVDRQDEGGEGGREPGRVLVAGRGVRVRGGGVMFPWI